MGILHTRRSDYDVSNRVQVSDPLAVAKAVREIYGNLYPNAAVKPLEKAFTDFVRLMSGEDPRFHGCETTYHDLQHSLDVALALARHVDGYERSHKPSQRMGAKRAAVGMITALYHDVGYLRSMRDRRHRHGAEYTLTHVGRGGSFLNNYLSTLGLGSEASIASRMIHFTGYERDINHLRLGDDRYTRLGHLLGTADLTAQMADRCYLEKCRDRLYAEFVLAGVALPIGENGHVKVRYASGLDLLRQTPKFVFDMRTKRLDGEFNRAYRFLEILFGGRNPYIESIDRNLEYLQRILRSENWRLLRRQPPVFTGVEDSMATTRTLMLGAIKKVWG
jgi:hypothetical protein